MPLPITFLSDYGYDDEFAGVCRAVIAQIAPGAPLIDLTHGIDRQGVRHGALALANATIAAIGPGTAAAIGRLGILPYIVPERFIAESLIEALEPIEVKGRPVLIARAAQARDVLPDALRERGAEVDVVALYETVAERPSDDEVGAAREADYVTFTSSSTVRNFVAAVVPFPSSARVVSIGPVTTAAARDAGLEVHVEAERHDIDGLVDALLADAETVST